MSDSAICQHCQQARSRGLAVLKRANGDTAYQGCADCLIKYIDLLKLVRDRRLLEAYHAKDCIVCGVERTTELFDDGKERKECPLHVHAKHYLGRALQELKEHAADSENITRLCLDIADLLGAEV